MTSTVSRLDRICHGATKCADVPLRNYPLKQSSVGITRHMLLRVEFHQQIVAAAGLLATPLLDQLPSRPTQLPSP